MFFIEPLEFSGLYQINKKISQPKISTEKYVNKSNTDRLFYKNVIGVYFCILTENNILSEYTWHSFYFFVLFVASLSVVLFK